MKNKLEYAPSLVYYALGAVCLVMMVKVGMGAVTMVKAAMTTPDILFTHKVMYANLVSLGLIFVLMWISSMAFNKFANLGFYYWKIAKSEGKDNGDSTDNKNA